MFFVLRALLERFQRNLSKFTLFDAFMQAFPFCDQIFTMLAKILRHGDEISPSGQCGKVSFVNRGDYGLAQQSSLL